MVENRTSSARVVVTGIGLVTPFASDREPSWRAICEGRTATRAVELSIDPSEAIAGRRGDRSSSENAAPRLFRCAGAPAAAAFPAAAPWEDPVVSLAVRAAEEAWQDAQLDAEIVRDPSRVGCVVGTSKGGLWNMALARSRKTADGLPADLFLGGFPSAPAAAISRRFLALGPSLCPVAACATGLASLQRGVDLIREGVCDVVIAGSSDASLVPVVVASFQRLGVLARSNDPATACRPYDRERDGFVVGEGAGILILERDDHARERGARRYAEWLSGASLADAAGLTHLDPQATALQRLIALVLNGAGVSPEEVDYINLHGTGTRENDRCETKGLRAAFGSAADQRRCSSLKGALGHLLGAAGSVETALTLLALRDGIVPPTANLTMPDPECDLDYTPREPRRAPMETAMKLSLGFGGHLTACIVRRCDDH